ncbi:folylpolyglutamate synthase/dihydrofolate synthase family protein [Desulfuromonas sp. CSMB_57]|uniref:bifunctional folylpolyglutamate synthase/dihydrofolate synthase n=1 Tax=Desulfuromonas sp. CSMB_57 TaxID=2807629 RepID=UPI001CD4F781|nr:folylpolyglutamate synthase/dihydrofolate synthase family protein [Desulfuromonas sp. CSMB_57]
MDFRQSLDYLYGLQRFGIKLGLDNIRSLLDRLGQPAAGLPILHVAGTNGKGSTAAAAASILQRSGRSTGLYTSPHLHSFTERIQINRQPIPETRVATLTAELREAGTGLPLTFFEFTTALALLYFQRQAVDAVVLEVGMGGRLDATNVVTPAVSVITPICLDHAEHLGSSLAAIAAEKAGIVKPGTPVVIGAQPPEALEVLLARCGQSGAPAVLWQRDFQCTSHAEGFDFQGLGLQLPNLQPGLPGRHQHHNLAVAIAACSLFCAGNRPLQEQAIREGVQAVRWPGRLEWWGGRQRILLDGAHNEGGARVLADYLMDLRPGAVRWVVGMKGPRRAADLLAPLLPLVTHLYCTAPRVPEAVAPIELAELARAAGKPAEVLVSPAAALSAALADSDAGDLVLVAGSLFLVAEAREYLMTQETYRAEH